MRRGWRRTIMMIFSVPALVVAASGGLAATAQAATSACPNEAIRQEQHSSFLGDCRAYELVSPAGALPSKGSKPRHVMASDGGGAIAWFAYSPPATESRSIGSHYYLSRREDGHWATIATTPSQTSGSAYSLDCGPATYYSADLTHSILADGMFSVGLQHGAEAYCETSQQPLLSDSQDAVMEAEGLLPEPEGWQNLYLTAPGSSTYQPINLTPAAAVPENAFIEDATPSLAYVLFEEDAKLTVPPEPEAPSGEDLYEWTTGKIHLITVLPNGEPVVGKLVNGVTSDNHQVGKTANAAATFTHALSLNGSRVFFEANHDLLMRVNPDRVQSKIDEAREAAVNGEQCAEVVQACTVQVDASQTGGRGGRGTFFTANSTGTRVFFSDAPGADLTPDTESGSGANLYEYEVITGNLVDLTGGDRKADVLGFSGFGEQADGTFHLYFVAEGALTAGAPEKRPNLYVVTNEGGSIRPPALVATLNAYNDSRDWGKTNTGVVSSEYLSTDTSPTGDLFAFESVESEAVVGYHNAASSASPCRHTLSYEAVESGLCSEIFLYEAATGAVTCISCNWEAKPTGNAAIGAVYGTLGQAGPGYQRRNVLNDGRVFFESPDPLVPGDTNGAQDVYEYYQGHRYLISNGSSPEASYFADATANGSDVFFTTSSALVERDGDESQSLYDAREGGNIFESSLGVQECTAEECGPNAAPATPPAFSTPASMAYTGVPNFGASVRKRHTRASRHTSSRAKRQLRWRRRRDHALKRCREMHRHTRKKRRACERRERRRYASRRLGSVWHGKNYGGNRDGSTSASRGGQQRGAR